MNWVNNNILKYWYSPELLESLAYIDYDKYYFKNYWIRHPYWIFKFKLEELWKSFLKILQEINKNDNLKIDVNNKVFINLINELFKNLIKDFQEFLEIFSEITIWFYSIIRNEKNFFYQDLNGNKIKEWINFYNLISNDISYYRELNNHFKHTGNYIEYIELRKQNLVVPWYFVSTINKFWNIVPNEKYHKKWNNKYTWTSFNKELKNIYYLIYKISDLFDYHIISKFISDKVMVKVKEQEDDLFKKIYENIIKLGDIYFPNEENKLIYTINLRWDYLKISQRLNWIDKNPWRIILTYTWDWHSKSFWLLYK